ncbi:MAG: alpha-L-fucosidase [Acidimicrobiaceae bacterium]|nr:alpha-L-fucosidase [Acidimicrobiaceae bacterium]
MLGPSRLGRAQVHLDFHTSEHLGAIGGDFDADEFAEKLGGAGIDQVNLFAKCHHGWSYYPTGVGCMHPGLRFDLLGEQIRACQAAGLAVAAYYTVGWSAQDLNEHPEWAAVGRDGTPQAINVAHDAKADEPRPPTSWVYLCPDGEYLDLMVAQVEEIARLYDPDGLWFDICATVPCFCARCRAKMSSRRVDLGDGEAVRDFNQRRWQRALQALRRAARTGASARPVFFNGTTVLHGDIYYAADARYGLSSFNSHQEMEHLPTTWGGYDKLPLRARYYHSLGYDLVAMSGKFHTSWGEFGGYKSQRALEYEARSMIANGARCSFGDQLHPSGCLDDQTYDLLGTVYRSVAELNGFTDGARPYSRLALCPSESEDDDQGVARALLEAHREFVVVTPGGLDPACHDAVVVAGPLPDAAGCELVRFASAGGRILALGDAARGLARQTRAALLGIDNAGEPSGDGDYSSYSAVELVPLGSGLAYNYEPGWRFELVAGAEVLAGIHDAYFDRTYGRYCSHENAPPQKHASGHPAVHRHGPHLVAAHPLGRLYLRHGAEVHRSLLWALFSAVDTRPVIVVSGLPAGGRVTVLDQPERSRTLVHALYAPPVQRGRSVVVDDVVAVPGVSATVRLDSEVAAASDGRRGAPLPLARGQDGSVSFDLPVIEMHAVVVLHHLEDDQISRE